MHNTYIQSLKVVLFKVMVNCGIGKALNCASDKRYVEVRSYIRGVHTTIEAGSRKNVGDILYLQREPDN